MKRTLPMFLILVAGLLCFGSSSHRQSYLPGVAEPVSAAAPQLNIFMLDVGQGDGLLVVSPTGKTALIDAGPRSAADTVVAALRRHNVSALDLVVATHPHEDQIGGMVAVLDAFPARLFLDSGRPYTTDTYRRMLEKIE